MDIKPYRAKLIAGVKNAIVQIAVFAFGSFIGILVAERWFGYQRHGWNWFVTVAAVLLAYGAVLWLLKHALQLYRRSPN